MSIVLLVALLLMHYTVAAMNQEQKQFDDRFVVATEELTKHLLTDSTDSTALLLRYDIQTRTLTALGDLSSATPADQQEIKSNNYIFKRDYMLRMVNSAEKNYTNVSGVIVGTRDCSVGNYTYAIVSKMLETPPPSPKKTPICLHKTL